MIVLTYGSLPTKCADQEEVTLRKNTLVVVAVVVALLAPSYASAQEEGSQSFTFGCEVGWYSSYTLVFGLENTEPGEGSIQTSCTLAHQSGFFVGVWRASSDQRPFDRATFANENNFLVGFNAQSKIDEQTRLNVNGTFWYFDLANPKTERFGDGDMVDFAWRIAVERDNWVISPYVSLDVLVGLGESGFDSGWYGHVGAASEIKIGVPIGLDASLMRVERVGGNYATYTKLVVTPRFELGDKFALALPIRYWLKMSGSSHLESEFVFGASVSF